MDVTSEDEFEEAWDFLTEHLVNKAPLLQAKPGWVCFWVESSGIHFEGKSVSAMVFN